MVSVVVVVPFYTSVLSKFDEISLSLLKKNLGDYHIVVVAPGLLEVPELGYPVERFDDQFFDGVVGYNQLLVSSDFYQRFHKFEFMLIYQLDALVVEDRLADWCGRGFDYIGGVWDRLQIEKNEGVEWPYMERGCGNGGFSLRRIASAISALEKVSEVLGVKDSPQALLRHSEELNGGAAFADHEDIFWCTVVPRYCEFNIAGSVDALAFSFEYDPEGCFFENGEELPFGAHAWYKFEGSLNFWSKALGVEVSWERENEHSKRILSVK